MFWDDTENTDTQDSVQSEPESPPPSEEATANQTEEASTASSEKKSVADGQESRAESKEKTRLEEILNSDMIYYERLPMLEVVFDSFIRMLSTSLRNFTSDTVDISLESIESIRFGDYVDAIPLPAMISVIKAEEWDNYGLITVDSSLIYSVIDVLLGGRRGTAVMRIEGRAYTTIERNLIERMVHTILQDLSASFEPLSPVSFKFERLETNPKFATISRPPNSAILIRLHIDMDERGGNLEILFPYATLEPIRELLLQNFMGEKFGRDSIWENHLASQLWTTGFPIQAILDQVSMKLGDVLRWKVGTHIPLQTKVHDPIKLNCGDRPMFSGNIGRKGDFLAIKVDELLFKEEEI